MWLIESRKMLPNASYFAFTAAPKNETLEPFGERYEETGEVHFRSPPELTYTTKQAIQEGFILDVIQNYTPVDSFYRVAKTVEDDPEFDKETFIPWELVKRGVKKEVITPIDAPQQFREEVRKEKEIRKAEQDTPLVKW